jgi:hypothetical protein
LRPLANIRSASKATIWGFLSNNSLKVFPYNLAHLYIFGCVVLGYQNTQRLFLAFLNVFGRQAFASVDGRAGLFIIGHGEGHVVIVGRPLRSGDVLRLDGVQVMIEGGSPASSHPRRRRR